MKLMPNCRETTRLVLAGEDRRLRLGERIGVRLHLMACHGCTHFSAQVLVMREAMKQWRAGRDGPADPPLPRRPHD
ncbi:MAG: zf-HC2 domain-containing protein [Aquincola tertiaricarbonis]|uniref:anti-sigma factor family protein n=1 Tax=Aquincola TaxID=391952 RepID=UPI000614BADE|nr:MULTISPECIES: hypothetical protein [Aquincola]MCR5865016.1 zf-HC2 domain-containing protein [Aquincola sp. J276]